jgi:hypothetical protein
MRDLLSPQEIKAGRARRLRAMHLQRIEGNPLSPDEVAMFEEFEREAWPHGKCVAFILDKARRLAAE